jgi:hypothetical protein
VAEVIKKVKDNKKCPTTDIYHDFHFYIKVKTYMP